MSTIRNTRRSVMALFAVLLVAFVIVGCGVTTTTTTTTASVTTTTTTTVPTTTTTTTISTQDPVAALEAIVITGNTFSYNSVTDRYTTRTNIVLPTSVLGLPIVWSTTNAAAISTAGVVVRPAYGTSDTTVILTATIGDETRDFIITVVAEQIKPAALVLQEAKDALLLAGIGNGVSANLTLPATVGSAGVTVTWSSNLPAIITNAGVVTRQTDNTTVVLTATLSYQSQTVTKEFEVVVLAFAEYTVVESINEALALPELSYVKILGVTIVGRTTDGFMIADESNTLFVYTVSIPNEAWAVGNVYDIYGMTDFYFSPWQLNSTAEKPLVLVPSTAAATVLTPVVVDGQTSVSSYIATLPTTFSETAPLQYTYMRITAKVRVQSATDNYATLLVDPNYAGGNIETAANTPFKPNAFVIYYKSNKAALLPFDGLVVTMDVFLYSLRTDRNVFTVIFTGVIDDIQTQLDDAGIVAAVKAALPGGFQSEYAVASTLTLPTSMLGTTIAWSTTSPLLNLTTGALAMPASGQETVTLTATLTRGTATDTLNITFKAGEIPIYTSAQIQALPVNTLVRMEGIITAITEGTNANGAFSSFYLQDATGGMFVFSAQVNRDLIVVGNKVVVSGTFVLFNGSPQFNPVTKIVLVSTGNTVTPTVLTTIVPAEVAALKGMMVSVTGYLRNTITSTTRTFHLITPFGEVQVYVSNAVAADRTTVQTYVSTLAAGTEMTITANLGWFASGSTVSPQLALLAISQITAGAVASNETLLPLIQAGLTLPVASNELIANLTLPTTGRFGSTVVWTSSNTAVISNTGVVTRPSFNAADAPVTLTYEIKRGDVVLFTNTINFTVLKKAELTEAEKVDADGAAISIPATVTAAGTITLPATGTNGSAIVWASNNALINAATGEVTMPESGTVTVVLTATLTLGATVKDFTFNVEVGVPEVLLNIMIYEVYGGGGNSGSYWKQDFVVLYNPNSVPVSLAGYSLQYNSATGTTWANIHALTGTIPANSFYLIREAQGTGGTADLPSSLVKETGTLALSGTGGKIALVNSTTALVGANPSTDPSVVDFVGWGTTSTGFETALAPATTNSTSIRRKTLVDSNNNSTDFEVITLSSTSLDYLN